MPPPENVVGLRLAQPPPHGRGNLLFTAPSLADGPNVVFPGAGGAWTVDDVPTDAAHAARLRDSAVAAGPPVQTPSGGVSVQTQLHPALQQHQQGFGGGSFHHNQALNGSSGLNQPGTPQRDRSVSSIGRPRRFQKAQDPSKRWHEVDMSNVGLRQLTPSSMAGIFDHLTHLHLSHNRLSNIPAAVFSIMKQLVHLDLSWNELSTLPSTVNQLQNLMVFDLRHNNLQDLPIELGHLIHLEHLLLDANSMLHTPPPHVSTRGTEAVILWLRERMPIGTPPPERLWLHVPQAFATQNDDAPSFKVMCYNVLADALATQDAFPYAQSWMLDWNNFRKDGLLKEILTRDCDIVCLQEVEQGAYLDFLEPQLAQNGYEGYFGAKSRARTMDEYSANRVDGCATFFKTATFRRLDVRTLEFQSLVLQRGREMFDTSKADQQEAMQRLMTKDQIATALLLQHRGDEHSNRNVVVANTHIHWNPEFCDVKLMQTQLLTEQLEELTLGLNSNHPQLQIDEPRISGWAGAAVVLCGDLNSQPEDGPYRLLAGGQLPGSHADLMGQAYGPYSKRGMRHQLRLRSAYSTLTSGEPTFTNYTAGFVGTLDYIFFSEQQLRAQHVLAPVSEDVVRASYLPNAYLHSDHVSIAVKVQFIS